MVNQQDTGASVPDRVLSPAATEPVVSAHSGNTPSRDDDWVAEAIARHLEKHPPQPPCEHEFGGWRDFPDGNGGEQFCQKCGLGAMADTLMNDWD